MPLISRRPATVPAAPPVAWPEEGTWAASHALWNHQQAFDSRLQRDRSLRLPRDVEGRARQDSIREWVLGECFAFLEELAELLEARARHNPEEETVDTLHFVLSLAERLDMTPQDLGRFEDRFARAAAHAGDAPWDTVLLQALPDYVAALADLKGGHFKWWKNQPDTVDWAPQREALSRIDHLNLVVASRVFPDAETMVAAYMEKVAQNHARQEGRVAGREAYQA